MHVPASARLVRIELEGTLPATEGALLVRDGAVQWHTSHLAITVGAIHAAVANA